MIIDAPTEEFDAMNHAAGFVRTGLAKRGRPKMMRRDGLTMTIYLAPLQGMTDRIYRNVFPLYFRGVDVAVAPFIPTAKKIRPEARVLQDLRPEANPGIPFIPQIMGANPDDFVGLANVLFDMGHSRVNWNLGCPFPMVVKKGRGAGMLCYPDRIEAFLEQAMPRLKPGLSIKLRLGLKYSDDILTLLPIFNRFDLTELIIHPRTGAQMYEGRVDLDSFEKCLSLTKHRVVYNGDIASVETYRMLADRFDTVLDWMIGRGLLANPFLAEEIRSGIQTPRPQKIQTMRVFHDHLFDAYSGLLCGPGHLTSKMKEVWTYMAGFFEDEGRIRKKINKTSNPSQYLSLVHTVFDTLS